MPDSVEANVRRSEACGDHSGIETIGARNRRSQRGTSVTGPKASRPAAALGASVEREDLAARLIGR